MFGFFATPSSRLARFFDRFRRQVIIVHRGFAAEWLEALFKLPGGAGYFRFDVRQAPGWRPTPIEWVVHRHVMPLELPVPLLMKVGREELLLRHLTRDGKVLDPSEIGWMLDEIETRHHARLVRSGDAFEVERGLPVGDNDIDYDFSL